MGTCRIVFKRPLYNPVFSSRAREHLFVWLGFLRVQDTFQQLKLFIDVYLQASGKGDFSGEAFSIQFNSDMPVNESEIITGIMASRGLVSDRTLLAQHPYVEDVDKEIERIEEEKQKALAQYGEGLFRDTFSEPDGDMTDGGQ